MTQLQNIFYFGFLQPLSNIQFMKRKISRISHISVGDLYTNHGETLNLTLMREDVDMNREITQPTTNRPGLALSGFLLEFARERVQIIGNAEIAYIRTLDHETLEKRLKNICELNVPCFIISRGADVPKSFLDTTSSFNIPVFRSDFNTITVANSTALQLEKEFSQTTTAHGCMINFRGIGVLIKGKSGSGKSETAIGLVERGGALVADDHVKIRNTNGELTAYTEDFCRGFIEMRGIGIINVANIYGLGTIQPDSKLDIIINLKPYSDLNEVDRVGINRKTENVLGVEVPYVDIPVAPGRDTARLVAVTILELQLRRLGYDMASEFNSRLNEKIAGNQQQP